MGCRIRLQGRALAALSLFVDTSVWSLAFRRDAPAAADERLELVRAIEVGEELVTTGLVLQALLQVFSGPRDRKQILDRFAACAAARSRPPRPYRRGRFAKQMPPINADRAAFKSARSMPS
jgi:predicted nucleic acid-binding protein